MLAGWIHCHGDLPVSILQLPVQRIQSVPVTGMCPLCLHFKIVVPQYLVVGLHTLGGSRTTSWIWIYGNPWLNLLHLVGYLLGVGVGQPDLFHEMNYTIRECGREESGHIVHI